MTWAVPRFTKSRIDRAGATLISTAPSSDALDRALEIVNNWRSCHSFPLNTFQTTLRRKARRVESLALTSQRIKRLSSIDLKLRRFHGMKLSRMQDLGGCRAILSDVKRVYSLRKAYAKSDLRHALADEKDYIKNPKSSGYRGIHLIYKYVSDRTTTYNGLLIEIQLRTKLQHTWATAVETVGTLLRQSLKSSQGEDEWLRFFSLMGTVIAEKEESPPVPQTPVARAELVAELRERAADLQVTARLTAYAQALKEMEKDIRKDTRYYLLEVYPSEHRTMVTGFSRLALDEATSRYLDVEKSLKSPDAEAVLVSVSSVGDLRAAYPNYFLDTQAFLQILEGALSG